MTPLSCLAEAIPLQKRLTFAPARPPWELSIWNHVILISQLQHFLNHDNNITIPNPNPKSMCEKINHYKLSVKRSFPFWDHRLIQIKISLLKENLFCSPDSFQQSYGSVRVWDFCRGFNHGSLKCHFLPPTLILTCKPWGRHSGTHTQSRWRHCCLDAGFRSPVVF